MYLVLEMNLCEEREVTLKEGISSVKFLFIKFPTDFIALTFRLTMKFCFFQFKEVKTEKKIMADTDT